MCAMLWWCYHSYMVCLAKAYGPIGCARSLWIRYHGCQSHVRRATASYDPSHDRLLDDHCSYATLAYGMGVVPTQSTVYSLRRRLRKLWELHPERLAQVAAAEGLSSGQYLESVERRQWGGISDMMLLTRAARRELMVRDLHGSILAVSSREALVGERRCFTVRWHDGHYTVPPGADAGPRSSRRFRKAMRRIDRSIEQLTKTRRQEGEQDVPDKADAEEAEARGGMQHVQAAQMETENQQREQFMKACPDLVQRRGGHHRCTLCQKWATAPHLASQQHRQRIQQWEEQPSPDRSKELLRAERLDQLVLGRARGAPRCRSRSREKNQARPDEEAQTSTFHDEHGRLVCVVCEAMMQTHHEHTEEHKMNWQSWGNMTEEGRGRFRSHAIRRWEEQNAEARGGMQSPNHADEKEEIRSSLSLRLGGCGRFSVSAVHENTLSAADKMPG